MKGFGMWALLAAALCLTAMVSVHAQEAAPAPAEATPIEATPAEAAAPIETTPAEAAPAEAPAEPAAALLPSTEELLGLEVAESFTGTVATMTSADKYQVLKEGTPVDVRLYGADAPEPGQPMAEEAKAAVVATIGGNPVRVDVLTKDNLGVAVAVVVAGEVGLSHLLVGEGLAWYDDQNAPGDKTLKRLNAEAIAGGRGIWKEEAPLAPWDFRRSHGGEQFKYSVKPEEAPAKPAEPEKEEVKSVSAKGDQVYTSNYTLPAGAKMPEGIKEGDLIMRHQPQIATDASGKPLGFTATNISQIPFAKELGFQDGDIITSVNGIQTTDINQIMMMAPQFKDVKEFNVTILRGGKPVNQTIRIP